MRTGQLRTHPLAIQVSSAGTKTNSPRNIGMKIGIATLALLLCGLSHEARAQFNFSRRIAP